MDCRNVRISKPYGDGSCADDSVYIDELARDALHVAWGEQILLVGRRNFPAKVAPLRDEDFGSQTVRMTDAMREHVYCVVGDEILLYNLE